MVVLHHPRNRGKGAALITAFNWCQHKELEAVITMDGDGQHDSRELPNLIRHSRTSGCDIIVGSRMHDRKGMPRQRIMTNTVSSRLMSWLTGQTVPDSQSGFRLIRSAVLRSLSFSGQYYDLESELLIKAAGAGYTIGSIPVPSIYNNQTSHFHGIKDTLAIARVIFKGCLSRLIHARAHA